MHPVLFTVFGFPIASYGVLITAGAVLAILFSLWRAKQIALPAQTVLDIAFFCVLGGMVGGRLGYILSDLVSEEPYFLAHPWEMVFSRYGFVFLYGLIFALAIGAFMVRRAGLNVWKVLDVILVSLPLAHALGRVGCFASGCCYGGRADEAGALGFLAVRYPRGTHDFPGMAWVDHVEAGLIPQWAETSLPVWPVQLFESAGNLVIFVLLFFLWKTRRFYGQMLLYYLVLYGGMRFFLEFLRGDALRGFVGPLSTSQALSLAGLALAALLWRRLSRAQPIGASETQDAKPPAGRTAKRTGRKKSRKAKG